MKRSTGKNVLFALIAVLVLFLIVELLLRAAYNFSGEYLARREGINYQYRLWQMQLFNTFQGMNEPDADLFWRLKPNYRSSFITVNSAGFAGPEIEPKQPDEMRVLFLGDSTPLGVGLKNSSQSFVRQLEGLLEKREDGRPVSVINASVAGYSSWQCRKQLELRGESLQPDVVVTYFGNNDPSINGYLSDRQLYEQTRYTTWLNRTLAHSYLYQVLKGIVLKAKEQTSPNQQLLPRVSVEESKENVQAISQWCQAHNCALILCTSATPDLWPPGIQFLVFAGGTDSQGRLIMADELQQQLKARWDLCLDTTLLPGRGDVWTEHVYSTAQSDSLSPEKSAEVLARELTAHPDDARLWNNLGVAIWKQRLDADTLFERAIELDSLNPVPYYNAGIALFGSNSMISESYLKHAKELDNYSLRIKAPYNNSYRSFCERNDATLVDAEILFADLPEKEYFMDHCHPTLKGHELIAGELVNVIVEHVK